MRRLALARQGVHDEVRPALHKLPVHHLPVDRLLLRVGQTRDLERLPFFEVKGNGGQREACTFRIADPAAAKEVADRSDAAASLAAHEGCPSRG